MAETPMGLELTEQDILAFLYVPKKRRINATIKTSMGLEQTEQDILAFEISDEALEAAAGTVTKCAANYTLAACSGLSVCPA